MSELACRKPRFSLRACLAVFLVVPCFAVADRYARDLTQVLALAAPAVLLTYSGCRRLRIHSYGSATSILLVVGSSLSTPLVSGERWFPGADWLKMVDFGSNVLMLVVVPLLVSACVLLLLRLATAH